MVGGRRSDGVAAHALQIGSFIGGVYFMSILFSLYIPPLSTVDTPSMLYYVGNVHINIPPKQPQYCRSGRQAAPSE